MSLVFGRRSALVTLVVLLISAVTFVAASQTSAASAVDIVILGGESAVSASVAAELETCTSGSVVRLAGNNRYNTATEISKATFPSATGAYIATGLNFPDALAGGPPAALNSQPVLLVNDAVPASTLAELVRLGVSSVTVLGGSAVVPDSVVTSLNTLIPTTRIAGSDRYSTAAAIVQARFASADTVYVATGLNFPDALAGVPAAAGDSAPILLVQQNSIPAATAAQLSRLKPTTIRILGGEAVVSAGVANALSGYASSVVRLAGSDRYATAAAISMHAFPSGASKIYIATGLNYPDALAGGPAAGVNDAPILLVQPDAIPGSTKTEIQRITGTTCAPTTTTTTTTVPGTDHPQSGDGWWFIGCSNPTGTCAYPQTTGSHVEVLLEYPPLPPDYKSCLRWGLYGCEGGWMYFPQWEFSWYDPAGSRVWEFGLGCQALYDSGTGLKAGYSCAKPVTGAPVGEYRGELCYKPYGSSTCQATLLTVYFNVTG